MLPLQLIYFVTNRCNYACKHCFLENRADIKEEALRPADIERLSSTIPFLVSLSITGGEPFIRNDIVDLVRAFYKNTKINSLVINTNGYAPDRIKDLTSGILKVAKGSRVFFGISLDGIGEKNDEIRGVRGSFENALKTYNNLKVFAKEYKNFTIGIGITCSIFNKSEIMELYRYVRDKIKPDNIGINLMRGKNWKERVADAGIDEYASVTLQKENDSKAGFFKMSRNNIFKRAIFAKELAQYELIKKIYINNRYTHKCFAGSLLAVMAPGGDIYPCEMIGFPIGNIKDFNFSLKKLWSSKEAKNARKYIKDVRCFCTYECALATGIFFNPVLYPTLIKKFMGM